MWHLYRPYNVLVKRVCMDVASLSTLKCSSEKGMSTLKCSSEKGMYGCGIFIDLIMF